MRKAFQFLAVAILALLLAGAYKWLFPSDESRIRQGLDNLAVAVSFAAPQGALATLGTVNGLRDLLAAEVSVDLSGISGLRDQMQGREEIIQLALAVRSQLRKLRVRFADIQILIGSDHQSAVANVVALADLDEEKNSLAQVLKMEWRKADKKWRITRVETVEPPGRL